MYSDGCEQLSERECVAVFGRLFPRGLAGQDVIAELAPGDWAGSPLVAVYHPPEEIRARWYDEPVDPQREVRELVGRCLWDVFSDNHEVIAPDGREVHLGSWRGSGDFIADVHDLDRRPGRSHTRLRDDFPPPRRARVRLGVHVPACPRQRAELHEFLEVGHREALEISKDRPPPTTVDAYRQAYGGFPRGWPPWD